MSDDFSTHDGGLYKKAYTIQEHEVKDFYAEWAATYDEELIGGKGYALPGRCADAFDRHVRDRSARIMDIGCGTGLLASRLADLGFGTIDGIDYSPEMLEQAEGTGAYRGLFAADVNEPLEFDDGAYDAVAAMGVFSFFHVKANALDEMLRIIVPGGHLIIGVNDPFYDEGSLVAKLGELETAGSLSIVEKLHGPHMPASGVEGWVIVGRTSG